MHDSSTEYYITQNTAQLCNHHVLTKHVMRPECCKLDVSLQAKE